MRFTIVTVYYFTKLVEVKPIINIIEVNTCKFILNNIIYHLAYQILQFQIMACKF